MISSQMIKSASRSGAAKTDSRDMPQTLSLPQGIGILKKERVVWPRSSREAATAEVAVDKNFRLLYSKNDWIVRVTRVFPVTPGASKNILLEFRRFQIFGS